MHIQYSFDQNAKIQVNSSVRETTLIYFDAPDADPDPEMLSTLSLLNLLKVPTKKWWCLLWHIQIKEAVLSVIRVAPGRGPLG